MIKVQLNLEIDTDMHDATRILETITDQASQIDKIKIVYVKAEDKYAIIKSQAKTTTQFG